MRSGRRRRRAGAGGPRIASGAPAVARAPSRGSARGRAPAAAWRPRASIPSEWVAGSSSSDAPPGASAGRPGELQPRRVRRRGILAERRRGAVDVAELASVSASPSVEVPAAAAEEARLEAVLAQPCGLLAHPVGASTSSCGRAWVGPPQWVWCPSGASAGARPAPARATLLVLSRRGVRAAASGGVTTKPPGRRRSNDSKACQTRSSSGLSTWQETTA